MCKCTICHKVVTVIAAGNITLWILFLTLSFSLGNQTVLFVMDYLSVVSFRSSRPEVLYKKGVLRNFAKFTGKHLCQSLFFNKVAGQASTLYSTGGCIYSL